MECLCGIGVLSSVRRVFVDLVGATFSRFVSTKSVVYLGSFVVVLWQWGCRCVWM